MDNTELEVKRLVQNGMNELSQVEFLNELDQLGYKMKSSYNYYNSSNCIKYLAKTIEIVEKDSGLSFANIKAKRDDNFKQLQNLRYTSFVYNRGRIWEI